MDDNNNVKISCELVLKPNNSGIVSSTVENIKLKTPTFKLFIAKENLISNEVVLHASKTALLPENADYRIATLDFLAERMLFLDSSIFSFWMNMES